MYPLSLKRSSLLAVALISFVGSWYLIYAAWPTREHDLWTEYVLFNHGDLPQGHEVQARFELVNHYPKPLEIFSIAKGCKCTQAELSKNRIEPGEKAVLQLVWKTGQLRGRNGITIELLYRLPDGSVFSKQLRVEGNVVPDIETEPEKLVFAGDRTEVVSVRLVSGRMKEFVVSKAYCNHPAFKAELRPDNTVEVAYDAGTPVYSNGFQPQLILETSSPNEPVMLLRLEISAPQPEQ